MQIVITHATVLHERLNVAYAAPAKQAATNPIAIVRENEMAKQKTKTATKPYFLRSPFGKYETARTKPMAENMQA